MTVQEFKKDKTRFENYLKEICMAWQEATGVEIDSIDIIKKEIPDESDEDGETYIETSEISEVTITVII